ncbi:hypothetical protein CROQUDRAFT_130088 [Cronartium quercuum f. sp. fusiforme G11]|uniref:Uncharacterized protein n=1 Tax=Cronartium quercuum f. sp. fusiforme G11 TaxID=708437 RepID=A0A9P6NQC3_9BASI|nr:hypothetical protein CROQUDRAFT_130088 [Cronartium quercuum f. sp. fusiforme G11]
MDMSARRAGKSGSAAAGEGLTPVRVPAPQDSNGVFTLAELELLTEEQRKAITEGNWVVVPPGELKPAAEVTGPADGTVTLTREQSVAWEAWQARERAMASEVENKMATISLEEGGDKSETDLHTAIEYRGRGCTPWVVSNN